MKFISIIITLFLFVPSVSAKTTFPNQATCNFQVFRTDVPDVKENYTIHIVSGSITEFSDRVSIEYNGQRSNFYCDGSSNSIRGSSDMLSCRIDRSGNVMANTSIHGRIIATSPYTFRNAHSYEPALDYPTLAGTSAARPFCDTDEYSRECKWQVQNLDDPDLNREGVGLNEWVVYAETEVTFTIGYTVDNSILKLGDVVCGEDILGDGMITDEVEFSFCKTGNPNYLCPRDAISCYNEWTAGCSIGRLDTDIDRCIESPQCPTPGSFSQSRRRCVATYEEVCAVAVPPDPPVCNFECPAGYSYYRDVFGNEDCVNQDYFCANGFFIRPSGEDWYCRLGRPICLQGGIYHPETNHCYPDGYPCPYGPQYECTRAAGYSSKMCSELPCNSVEVPGSGEGSGDKDDDGEINANGECEGTIYIFNGSDRRCRSGGLKLAWDSCCRDKDYFIGLLDCRNSERELANLRDEELCVSLGSYCSKRISFIGGSACIETKRSFCCFNSKLAKVIHEQGRPQLKTFANLPFGRASNPNCRGFTPEEFQNLDFSKIDLSEWYDEIDVVNQSQITNSITDGVNNFYDKIY
jgi:type IV conjugative transfer system TraN protein involved in mating pair stabilization